MLGAKRTTCRVGMNENLNRRTNPHPGLRFAWPTLPARGREKNYFFPHASTWKPSFRRVIQNSRMVSNTSAIEVAAAAP